MGYHTYSTHPDAVVALRQWVLQRRIFSARLKSDISTGAYLLLVLPPVLNTSLIGVIVAAVFVVAKVLILGSAYDHLCERFRLIKKLYEVYYTPGDPVWAQFVDTILEEEGLIDPLDTD